MKQKSWMGGSPRRIAGVLDIGTSKVACLIAAVDDEKRTGADASDSPSVRVLGVGHQRSQGVKAGVITDLDQAEQAARAAIAQAERMAGVMLEEVRVAVTCGRLQSQSFVAKADVESGVVSDAEFDRLLTAGQAYAERNGRTLVHLNEVAVRLDGAAGVRDPRGMAARKIAMDLHAVTADEAPLRNLLLVVERCYVAASSLAPAPLASAVATTSPEERALGATVIDIGGGTTTLAMFAEGRFLHAAALPMGGNQITLDIARSLHTPLAEAERIKALYGTVVSAPSDEHDVFSYPATGEDEAVVQRMTKAELAEVIRPRVRAIVHHVREMLERSEVARFAGRSIVLTGGTSQLVGIADVVAQELGAPVRVARPQAISGLPPVVTSPAFSTVVGLLLAETPQLGARIAMNDRAQPTLGYLERVGAWLREGF